MIWSLILIGYTACIYVPQYWMYGEPYNIWISVFYYPLSKLIWAINTAVVIWLCITGNGGFVNRFLSWKVFVPLSRLTYSVYLTHVWIVWIYWGSRRDLIDLKIFSMLTLVSGVLLMSYFLGAIFSLLFESPFFKLQSHLKSYYLNDKNQNKIFVPLNTNAFEDSQIWFKLCKINNFDQKYAKYWSS